MKIGEKLKQLREDNDYTLKELSHLTGLSISFISDIENGRRNPSIENLLKLAKGLNASAVDLLNETGLGTPIKLGADEKYSTPHEQTTTSIRESGTIYSASSEIEELLEILHKRPELKALFSMSKNATKEDIEKTIKIIEALKEK